MLFGCYPLRIITLLTYDPPVNALLEAGYPDELAAENWPDYPTQFGLTPDHIPALLQMLQDENLWALWEGDSSEAFIAVEQALPFETDLDVIMFGPVYAWRTLGQLQAIAAIPALIKVLQAQDMDWCWEEFPQVFALMGPTALPDLGEALQDSDLSDENKITIVEGLERLAHDYPDSRDDCVRLLTDQLADAVNNAPDLNGSLVSNLVQLKATESVAVIEAAYETDRVEQMFIGSWPAVQVSLGLKATSDFTPAELEPQLSPAMQTLRENLLKLEEEMARSKKPTAWELGLPIDRHVFDQDAPPGFKALVQSPQSTPPPNRSGFGGGKAKKKKKKSKKKKR